MQVVRHHERTQGHKTTAVAVWDYPTEGKDMNGAIAVVTGRYPETGFVKNRLVTELVYVVSGRGQIVTPSREQDIGAGDFVKILPEEMFAWSGALELAIVTTPAFDAAQYVHVA